MKTQLLIIRAAIAIVLVVSAYFKFLEPTTVGSINHLAILLSNRPLQIGAAAFEVIIAVGLMLPSWRTFGWICFLWASAVVGLLAAMAATGIPISSCGCFGARKLSVTGHILVVLGLLMMSCYIATFNMGRPSRETIEAK